MKKIISAICALALAVGVTGCAKKPAVSSEDNSVIAETVEVEAHQPLLPSAENSVEMAKMMKLGWNLGNTLDAIGSFDMSSETSWGQPRVTKELISYIKEAGFTSIRIPVSWGNHTDADYNISPEWMSRVTEVVDYAMESGLYVILNSHHDNDYYYPTEEKYAESERYIRTIWTQIANNFASYGYSLVFESMNEPRLAGTGKEWWFADNDPEGVASIGVIVKLNQVFVDTVRATGGMNSTRFLMVPSNAAAPQNALNSAFTMPTDPAGEGRLLVSVHAYTPYDFAMNERGYDAWDGSRANELNFMDQLSDKFIKNGYGVVIGEFGATNKDNLADRVAWATDYTGKAASLGIACFLWDNGGTRVGSENFGMINRTTLSVFYADILNAMTASYAN